MTSVPANAPALAGSAASEGRRPDPDSGAGFRARYRPELEGLRAVAILLVAASHLWWGRISGGIDVFLVVSGYLITVTLVVRWIRTGEVGALRYLRSLGARLLPAAGLVLATVAVVATVLLATTRPTLLADVLRSTGWAAVFGENWYLAFATGGYLSGDRVLNPVEHFWALSMQVQFYVLWLGLVSVLAAVVGRRSSQRRRMRLAVTAIVLICLASWVWCLIETLRNQPVAYLDTSARIWEFGVGGLLALLGARLVPGAVVGRLVGWLGLGMIVSLGFLGDFDPWFPGIASLWPVAGTALVLVGANTARGGAAGFLGSRPMVWLGGLAFGLYLWHWPLISALAILQNRRTFGVVEGITIVLIALLASWVMKHGLEAPWQRWGRRSPAAAVTAGLLVIVVGASAFLGTYRLSTELADVPTPGASTPVLAVEGAPEDDAPDEGAALTMLRAEVVEAVKRSAMFPDDVTRAADAAVAAYGDGRCVNSTWAQACVFGDPAASHTAVILGDSVAASWLPAITGALGPSWQVVLATKGSCPAAAVASFADQATDPTWAEVCRTAREEMIDGIVASRPDLVILTSSARTLDRLVSGATGSEASREWREGMDASLRALDSSTSELVVLSPPPLGASGCGSADFDAGGSRCLTSVAESWRSQSRAERAATADADAAYIDTRAWFCTPSGTCPWAIGGSVVRIDTHHLTAAYSARLGGVLRAALLDAAPDLDDVGSPEVERSGSSAPVK